MKTCDEGSLIQVNVSIGHKPPTSTKTSTERSSDSRHARRADDLRMLVVSGAISDSHPTPLDHDPLGEQPSGVLGLEARDQPATGGHHPPPG